MKSALHEIPGTDVYASAIMIRSKINTSDFELLLREQTIREWKDLDQIHPHDANASSRIMRTYHTHFGVLIGSQPGWWDDQKHASKPSLPSYLRHNVPNHLSCALSRLRISGHNLNVERLRQQQHRVPYELSFLIFLATLFAAWLASDFVPTLYELKLWPGLTIPLLLVTCVMLMMYRMSKTSFSTAPIHTLSLSKELMLPFFLPQA